MIRKSSKLTVAELDGLPQDYIDRHKPGADGKVKITTNYPDIFPVFQFAKSDDLRRRMNIAFDIRAYPKNDDVLTADDADSLRHREVAWVTRHGRITTRPTR